MAITYECDWCFGKPESDEEYECSHCGEEFCSLCKPDDLMQCKGCKKHIHKDCADLLENGECDWCGAVIVPLKEKETL